MLWRFLRSDSLRFLLAGANLSLRGCRCAAEYIGGRLEPAPPSVLSGKFFLSLPLTVVMPAL